MSKLANFTPGQRLAHNHYGKYNICVFQSEIDEFTCKVTISWIESHLIAYYQDLVDLESYKRIKRLDIYKEMQRLQKKLIGIDNDWIDEIFN